MRPLPPVYRLLRRRPDAQDQADHPSFPGHVFCRLNVKKRLPVLMTTGVVSILGFGAEPTAIPDGEIDAVNVILRFGFPTQPCACLQEGPRVRLKNGSLEGVEVVSVAMTMLQRSISVGIDGDPC